MKETVRLFFISGLFFISDRIFKFLAQCCFTKPKLITELFGWYPFNNLGVAFGVSLPLALVIPISILILLLFVFILLHSTQRTFLHLLGIALIISGAASNLIDRVLFKYVVDYLLILTGVINLADILVVVGFVLFITTSKGGKYVSQT